MRTGRSRLTLTLSGLAFACLLSIAPVTAGTATEPRTNRLIHSANPYLLQHAHNPVDWYPWGEEAFTKARQENKPIFLSVGYSTCYWCHVAERTIYSNPAIAALMNKWFVNVKVDREERPDVDETYMLARQLLTGSGGWPNNLFLTPDLKPFFAGSYFPPEDQEGATGFPTVLRLIHEDWQTKHDQVQALGQKVHDALTKIRTSGDEPASLVQLVPGDWLVKARSEILPRRDEASGGFGGGGGTKFPQSPLLGMLLTDYHANGTPRSLQAVSETLAAMAFGGIHDHLGGGMHRYSTEPTWSVPHFEKMLYDNAQLVKLYADLYAITRLPIARELSADIVSYLRRQMTAPGGGFYTAEDADIEGKEGESYLWTRAEITSVLGDRDADRFFALYELTPLPGEPDGPGVLRVRRDRTASDKTGAGLLQELAGLAPLRAKLLEVRDRRPQPLRDEKIVVGLNGLAISGLVRAGTVFDEPQWIAEARRAGTFLWDHAFDEKTGRLCRFLYKGEARGEGFLEDYAMLGLGFLDLGEATDESVWAARAAVLGDAIMDRFVKPDGTALTTVAATNLIVPSIDLQDHDTASGTSAAYALLSRLGKTEPRYAKAATSMLARMARRLKAEPSAWPSFTASAAMFAGSLEAAPAPDALDSASHVKATARVQSVDGRDGIVLTLTIDRGYHVNANPASKDYLIATTVKVPAVPDATITYPPGQTFKPKFLPEGIAVYEGSVPIKIEVPAGSLDAVRNSPLSLEVQACNLRVCLPPATIAVELNL